MIAIADLLYLDQAKQIVIRQNPPRRSTKKVKSAYANAQKITEDFFQEATRVRRDKVLEDSMSFLHRLISSKLESARDPPNATDPNSEDVSMADGTIPENPDADLGADDSNEDDLTVPDGVDPVFWKSKENEENVKLRLKRVSDCDPHSNQNDSRLNGQIMPFRSPLQLSRWLLLHVIVDAMACSLRMLSHSLHVASPSASISMLTTLDSHRLAKL